MAIEAIVPVVVDKLADLLIQEASFLCGVEDKVRWIETELRQMKCFLQNAEEKQQNDSNVKNWMNDIRDAAFDAEDVFETYILKKMIQKRRNLISKCVFVFNDLYTSHKICTEIERIQNNIREISSRRSRYGIEAIGESGGGGGSSSASERLRERRRISLLHHDDETQIVGLENDVNALKARLIGDSSPRRRCVISIVGMGGLGKTTLARSVYNCDDVKSHFQYRALVFISQIYDTNDLLQDIAKKCVGLERHESQKLKREDLEEKINGFLKERRYLIVMDDVWDLNLWDLLNRAFPDTMNGSRIIFTTRNKEVASHADPLSPHHELVPLSDDDSWVLFTKKLLSVEETLVSDELKDLGKKIVNKCGGLPLAIVVLGGFLSRKRKSIDEWSKVLDRINWQLNQDQTPCSQILALSYNDLPSYLKPCFLYLGIFPEDHEISSRSLINLWISEGFVQQRDNGVQEDIAEDYLEELVDRCMVQVASRRTNGSIKKCRIHDLLRDLAIEKAKEVQFIHVHVHIHPPSATSSSSSSSSASFPPLNIKVRRLSMHSTMDNFSVEQYSHRYIRSAFYFLLVGQKSLSRAVRSSASFGILRVLYLSYNSGISPSEYPRLPKAIGKLIHLRYLRLEYGRVGRFSSTIGNLRNLQILILNDVTIKCSRDAISKMDHLRDLQLGLGWGLSYDERLLNPPRGNNSSSVRNLQRLRGLIIDKESLVKDGWDKYTNLRKLRLRLEGDIESQVEALAGWIAKLERLESLSLIFNYYEAQVFRDPFQRLNICCSRYLYKLYLHGVRIEKLPDLCEFQSSLSQLTLVDCILGGATLPTLGKLPNLKFLGMYTIREVKDIIFVSGGFPQLQRLVLYWICDLEELTVEERALPCLRELSISSCRKLKALPDGLRHVTNLRSLNLNGMPGEFGERVKQNVGEDWEKVAHVPTINTINTLFEDRETQNDT